MQTRNDLVPKGIRKHLFSARYKLPCPKNTDARCSERATCSKTEIVLCIFTSSRTKESHEDRGGDMRTVLCKAAKSLLQVSSVVS